MSFQAQHPGRNRFFAILTGVWLFLLPFSPVCGQTSAEQPEEAFSRGVQALRKGNLAEAEKAFLVVLSKDPTASAHHNLGIVYQGQGKHELAIEEFTKALAMDPGFSQARALKGASLLVLRRIPEAVRELEQSVQLFPDQPLLRLQLARAYLRAGDQAGMIRQYQELVRQEPDNSEYRYLLGQAYMKMAEWSHRRIKELSPESPRLYQALAHAYLASGQLEQAAQALRLAIAFDPLLPELHSTLAGVYFQLGRLPEALQAVRAELRIVPENRGALELERRILSEGGMAPAGSPTTSAEVKGLEGARSAFYRGDFSAARRVNEEFLQANPSHLEARILRARILSGQNEHARAFTELHLLSTQKPDEIDVLYLGVLSAALSNEEYRQIFLTAPDSARAHYLTALAHETQGKTEDAIAAYEKALQANPDLVDALISQGDLLRIRSRFDEAAPRYEKVLSSDPDNYDALYGLGSCFHFRGEYEKGKDYFRKALRQDPASATAHLALGIALLRTDHVNEAVEHLERAVELEPEMDQAYLMLGQGYRRQGFMEKAREVLRKAETLKKRP